MSSRLTRNPGRSFVLTGCLPRPSAKASRALRVSSDDCSAATTSTSFIRCAGLKKCNPPNRSGRGTEAANAVTDRADVLVAMIARSPTASATAGSNSRFTSSSSTTASITTPAPLSSPASVVPRTRESVSSLASPVTFSRRTPSSRSPSNLWQPASRRSSESSSTTTSWPAWAHLNDAGAHRPKAQDGNRLDVAHPSSSCQLIVSALLFAPLTAPEPGLLIIIEPFAGLAPEVAGADHPVHQRWWGETRVEQPLVKDSRYGLVDV